MSIRVYACPWVSPKPSAFQSKLETFMPPLTKVASFFPSLLDGTPASTWVISFGRSDDWASVEADPTMIDLFAGDLPSSIQSRADFLTFLRGRTVADVPVARRTRVEANLDSIGVRRDDFVGSTTLWKVFQRVVSTLFEKSDNFGAGFNI